MFLSGIGIRAKLFGGFAIVLLITFTVGMVGFYSLGRVINVGDISTVALMQQSKLEEVLGKQQKYNSEGRSEDYDLILKDLEEFSRQSEALKEMDMDIKGLDELEKGKQNYIELINSLKDLKERNKLLLNVLNNSGKRIVEISEAEAKNAEERIRQDILDSNQEYLKDISYNAIRDIVNLGYDTAKFYYKSGKSKKDILEVLRNLHFSDGNYFFVVQKNLRLIAHGSRPELEGMDFGKIRDKKTGRTFMRDVVKGAVKHGVSFTDYNWTKPGMGDAVFPKVTVAKYFKPWDLVICAGIYVDDIESADQEMRAIVGEGLDELNQISKIDSLILNARLNALYHMHFKTGEKSTIEYLEKLKELDVATEGIKDAAQDYIVSWKDYAANMKNEEEVTGEADESILTGIGMIEKLSSDARELYKKTSKTGRQIILVLIIGSIVLGVAISFILVLSITKIIKVTSLMLKDIAEGEGDLTKRLNIQTKDEMGQLGKWFNLFMDKLQGIIRDISGNSETLGLSAEELSEISSHMSRGAKETSEKSDTVASSSEEMSSYMNSVAAASEQSAGNVNMVAAATEEMTSTIDEIARNSEKANSITTMAVDKAHETSEKVNQLGTAANEISKVTETITEISEQTNLLALNATIEAARAGDAGRGFAVVANEIKELAKQTSGAVDEINQRIEGVQGATYETVEDIEGISGVINEVNEAVSAIAAAIEEQSATTREIAGNISQASTGIQEVNEKVGQSSTVAGEIAKDISEVNQTSNNIMTNSSQVNSKAVELADLSQELKEMVDRFKI